MLSHTFLSNDPRSVCFATPPRGATKFENIYHIIKCYSVLRNTNTNPRTAVQRAFCTQLYMQTHRSVDFYGPLRKKHEHSQQLYRQKTQPGNLGFDNASDLLQCRALCLYGNSADWLRVQLFAKCTLRSG